MKDFFSSISVELVNDDFFSIEGKSSFIDQCHIKFNDNEVIFKLHNVGVFKIINGCKVVVYPDKNTDNSSINLFLKGSAMAVILQQRKILALHGTSFNYKNKGVIICGNSGTGKSSITTAFCQNGGTFISDDITPIRIDDNKAYITPFKTSIKLWDDSLIKLGISNQNLDKIRPSINKYYLPEQELQTEEQNIDTIFILRTYNEEGYRIKELNGIQKYMVLKNQIYRKCFLQGMPETERHYFKEIIKLADRVKVVNVFRPLISDIYKTMNVINDQIE